MAIKETKDKINLSNLNIRNILLVVVTAIITVTFIFTGGPLLGLQEFIVDLGKEKIKNPDGTYSIPKDAQGSEKRGGSDAYIARVLNERIQLGRDDEFNLQIQRIFNAPNLDPYMKYQYVRYFYDNAINKIIGMYNAQRMNIYISKPYLVKEIGKRYFSDKDGDPDFFAMKKDPNKVSKYAKSVKLDLLYEAFINDFFYGLPVAKEEIKKEYYLENTKISLKYINISNQNVNEDKLKAFFEANKNDYKQYKLVRLVFKEAKDAEDSLKEIGNDSKKFFDIGNKLKVDNKIINIVYDPEYSFIDDFENTDLKEAVKKTGINNISQSIIKTAVGPIIFLVQDEKIADLNQEKTKNKVKNDYITKNFNQLEKENLDLATEFYNFAKNNSFDKASSKFNLKIESTSNPVPFLEYGFPFLSLDNTDDKNYIVKLFKSNQNDIIEPYKHKEGIIVSLISEKIIPAEEEFNKMYSDLVSKYSKQKSNDLEKDYYANERKKIEIIDNFNYVFKPESFTKSNDNNQ